MSTLLISEDN